MKVIFMSEFVFVLICLLKLCLLGVCIHPASSIQHDIFGRSSSCGSTTAHNCGSTIFPYGNLFFFFLVNSRSRF